MLESVAQLDDLEDEIGLGILGGEARGSVAVPESVAQFDDSDDEVSITSVGCFWTGTWGCTPRS